MLTNIRRDVLDWDFYPDYKHIVCRSQCPLVGKGCKGEFCGRNFQSMKIVMWIIIDYQECPF